MKITKLGHCCLVVEEAGVRTLTDPGAWTTTQNEVKNIDIIIITHEHTDHLHLESLTKVLGNNPQAVVVTNSGVGKILTAEGIAYQLVEDGQGFTHHQLALEGAGQEHAPIYPSVPTVVNTGYFIGPRFYYPGDALHNPGKPVEILALPVCGPWLKIGEAIDYAKSIKPAHAFPVHDGMLKITGPFHALPERELHSAGITFAVIPDGKTKEY